MNSGSLMHMRFVVIGSLIWLFATLALRFAGQRILPANRWEFILLLFVLSFLLVAVLVRRVCKRARLPREQWLAGAVSLLLPTLLLDPFSSAFFHIVFPNISPAASGVFGGWMIACCAGALLGVLPPPRGNQ